MNSNFAIRIDNVSKKYKLGTKRYDNLRETFSNLFIKKTKSEDEFWALKNISFTVNEGDVIGIIGKNGAGKSTLLKILSEITKPTEGNIEINGRIASLLEVGTGFHPELTGLENVFLNGTILGMTRKEVKKKLDEIIDFSGVSNFIDTPVKHYSSGMYVRLAFAVAAHLEPEILIIDEVLAVGDAEFQKKCLGKMKDVAGSGRTVLFVSHHLGSVKQLCNKGVLLDSGDLVASGNIIDIISTYQNNSSKIEKYENINSNKEFYIEQAFINSSSAKFYNSDKLEFSFVVKTNSKIGQNEFLLIRIVDEFENVITASETKLIEGKKNYIFSIISDTLLKGIYKLNCIIYQPGVCQFDNIQECCNFEILNNNEQFTHLETFDLGKMYIKRDWK